MFATDDEVFLVLGQTLHREDIDPEAFDDLLFIYFAEELITDQPGSGTFAERALVRTHKGSLVGLKEKSLRSG